MDTQQDSAALEETEEIGAHATSADEVVADEITQAGEEWPVAREYRVADDGNGGIPPAHDEAGELVVAAPSRLRHLPLYIGTGLLGALLALLLVLGAMWLLSRGDDGKTTYASPPASAASKPKPKAAAPATVAVPDVSALEVSRARSVLQDAGLRVQIREVSSASDTAVPGGILRQTPSAGTDVSTGTVVVLMVSGEPPAIRVPEVVGLTASDASQALRDAGFRTDIRLVGSARSAGTVLDQAPSAGTDLAKESTVRLEVAKASPPVTIAVPRLVGSTAAQAKSQLRSLGLRWTASPVESAKPEGTVVAQSPNAGARLKKGQAVTLEISTGPAQVTVPDVIGLDEQSARARLEAAGYSVRVTSDVTTDPSQDGMVVNQTPAGGATSESGDTVTLTVARLG